ncbi:hypothetical protein KSP40_PGU001626 [Platanthera guangdongensis]|uniref:Tyrosinase copper-binding domain-containing protein n=1 Tax=Platanthera guangdongensis TaxID=2320717 RepID=A0ABR2MME6_9ASPA
MCARVRKEAELIHGSWHFFTWHRAYLYFYERILGKLINDTSFTIPFWNWDDPAGMSIPAIYRDNTSSLFNPTRYPAALNFTVSVAAKEAALPAPSTTRSSAISASSAVSSLPPPIPLPSSLAAHYSPEATTSPASVSPIENFPHNPVHLTTGSDMSVVTKAAVDPLFLPHHANIDRLWAIWDGLQGSISKVFDDADFLDASFLFWDEKMQRDDDTQELYYIDMRNLGYVYENVPLKWMNTETTVEDETRILCLRNFSQPKPASAGGMKFPLRLSSAVRVKVRRAPGESGGEKLVVFEIELDGRDESGGGGGRAQAGSFIHMERSSDKKIAITTEMQVGIAEVIKQIGAATDDRLVVTLDPKTGVRR